MYECIYSYILQNVIPTPRVGQLLSFFKSIKPLALLPSHIFACPNITRSPTHLLFQFFIFHNVFNISVKGFHNISKRVNLFHTALALIEQQLQKPFHVGYNFIILINGVCYISPKMLTNISLISQ